MFWAPATCLLPAMNLSLSFACVTSDNALPALADRHSRAAQQYSLSACHLWLTPSSPPQEKKYAVFRS